MALKTLHAMLTAKRFRVFQPAHEKIILQYIDLALELRRPAKDALMQFRNICQAVRSALFVRSCFNVTCRATSLRSRRR